MDKDLPRGRLVQDDILVEIAKAAPQTMEEMAHMRRGLSRSLEPEDYDALFNAILEARAQPADTHPILHKKKALPASQEHVVDVLRLLLKIQADKHHVASKLIASKEDLVAIIMGEPEHTIPAFHGWRNEIFGKLVRDYLSGHLVLYYDAGKRAIQARKIEG